MANITRGCNMINFWIIVCFIVIAAIIVLNSVVLAINDWATVVMGDYMFTLGLWTVCKVPLKNSSSENAENCDLEYLRNITNFGTTKWHTACKILTSLPMAVVAIIGTLLIVYSIIKRSNPRRLRLNSILILLMALQVIAFSTVLIMFGVRVSGLPEGKPSWCFYLVFLIVVFHIIIVACLLLDKRTDLMMATSMKQAGVTERFSVSVSCRTEEEDVPEELQDFRRQNRILSDHNLL